MHRRPRSLDGLRVAYAAFEPYPNAKGSGTRITEMVQALAGAGANVRLCTLPARDRARATLVSVEHRPLAVDHQNFLRRGQLFRDRLIREFAAFRPDIIHYRGLFEAQAAAAYRARASVRQVFEVNGLMSIELAYHYPAVSKALEFQSRLRALEEQALLSADCIITQSHATRRFLSERVTRRLSEVQVIPNAANPEDYSLPGRPATSVPRLLYAGTLAPWQGVAELFMAVRRVARHTPVSLAVAGPVRQRWRKQLKKTLRRLNLTDCVEILGPIQREALAAQIAASDVCLAPLRRDVRNARQGCSPIKLFEYMAAGRPVVSTDLPCVREIVVPGLNGVLATSARPSALADAVLSVLEQPEFASALGLHARDWVTRSATWAHRHRELERVYREQVFAS